MSVDAVVGTQAPATSALPLFYRAPVVLHARVHAGWRLKEGDLGFAAHTPYVPLVVGEIGEASRSYPVLFARDASVPVALLSLSQETNLFVDNGQWEGGHYVPAYVRRYPFGFVPVQGTDRLALALDTASERLVRGGGQGWPLFEGDGPSELTRQALQLCEVYKSEFDTTTAFVDALVAHDLLVERRAGATLADGRQYAVDGFRVVDPERFMTLDEATVLQWHRNGWLALVNLHLVSLGRLGELMERQQRAGTAAA